MLPVLCRHFLGTRIQTNIHKVGPESLVILLLKESFFGVFMSQIHKVKFAKIHFVGYFANCHFKLDSSWDIPIDWSVSVDAVNVSKTSTRP